MTVSDRSRRRATWALVAWSTFFTARPINAGGSPIGAEVQEPLGGFSRYHTACPNYVHYSASLQ